MRIGILALQGAFVEHQERLQTLGAETVLIRKQEDFTDDLNGLILPGGESTVMGKLLRELSLFLPIWQAIRTGLPVFGTCAGLILLAKRVEGGEPCLGTMDLTARRNAYGRQLGSFRTQGQFKGIGMVPMTFIRAPYIPEAAKSVRILASVGGKIVAAQQGNQLVTAFHPELTEDNRVHQYFLDLVNGTL